MTRGAKHRRFFDRNGSVTTMTIEPDARCPKVGPKAKPSRRRPDDVKARVVAAARVAFSSHGFEGASVRAIARDAHVGLSLLLYHFGTKENLWRAVMTDIMSEGRRAARSTTDRSGVAKSAADELRTLIEDLVRRFAENPDIHRLIVMEANRPSDRLIWLCEQFVKPDFDAVITLIVRAQNEGAVRKLNPARLRYAIVSLAAVPFSVSAEYQFLTGHNPFSSREIDSAIDFIHRIVFVDR